METPKPKILTLRNWLVITVVSYIFYSILWICIDGWDDEMNLMFYAFDLSQSVVFSTTSLLICSLIFKALPSKASFTWIVIYACSLFVANIIMAFGMHILLNKSYVGPIAN